MSRPADLGLAVPACAVAVVGAAFHGVAEDGVGGDDEAVAFEAGGVGEEVWG